MKTKAFAIVVGFIAVTGLIVTAASFAGRGPCGREPRGGYGRLYDAATVETVGGEVVKVDRIASRRGRSGGVLLLLKTEKEEIPVHLGPAWFLEKQGVTLAPGDRIEVTGSRVDRKGKTVVLAAQVKKGDALLSLRDGDGTPAWSGGKNR